VYSRATTSEMAERVFLPAGVLFLLLGLSFAIVRVWRGEIEVSLLVCQRVAGKILTTYRDKRV